MPPTQSLDVQDVINGSPVSGFQKLVVTLCFLVVAIDGFDVAAVGFIAPALRAEWGVTPAQLAPLFGAGLFGLMAGGFIFGPLADKWGRKPVLVVTTLFFGLATLASALSTSIEMLIALRFVTGLGLGGAMPAAVTLTSEFCPERKRASLVTLMFCGFTIGAAASGLAASDIVGAFGWRGLLISGGVLPLALAPVLLARLPESPRYLALILAPPERIAAVLRRIAPAANLSEIGFTGSGKPQGLPIGQLFQGGLVVGTLLLWTAFFMNLLVFYLLSSWLPLLITAAGFSLRNASLMATTMAAGGILGAIVVGRLMDRFEPHAVLVSAYLAAGGFLILLGNAMGAPALLVFAIFGAGFCVSGAQVGVNPMTAAYYPTVARATGVSWAHAVGRIGALFGSVAGGFLLSLGWDLSTVFAVAGSAGPAGRGRDVRKGAAWPSRAECDSYGGRVGRPGMSYEIAFALSIRQSQIDRALALALDVRRRLATPHLSAATAASGGVWKRKSPPERSSGLRTNAIDSSRSARVA